MQTMWRLSVLGIGLVMAWPDVCPAQPQTDAAPSPAQLAFFEKNIRPVLVRECYTCHATNSEKVQGGLKLDTREAMRKGGANGPVIVPGDSEKSRLIKAIRQEDDRLKMPPKKKLPDDIIADFEKWIAQGAADPREAAAYVRKGEINIEEGRKYWAFQLPKKPAVPIVKDESWPACAIDRFLLFKLEAKNLNPVADADAHTLLRRLSFDLIGLPPSPEEMEAFAKEYAADSQMALAKKVDRLLAMPEFGERWGRHWLDVARFAESSGRSANFTFPHAWRYRDYVIAAFNADKPFDQFIREQLAGDLLTAKDGKQKAEFLVATGFLAIGPKSLDERSPFQFQLDLADEQIDATFQAFQGLTVACARCHDHKFDPIPQKDYYALAGIFRSTQTCYGTIRLIQSNHPSSLITLPKDADVTIPLEPLTAERRAAIEKQIADMREQISKITGNAQDTFIRRIFIQGRITMLQSQLALYEADGTPKPIAMGVREGRSADSPLYVRGEIRQPSGTVKRGFPQVLTAKQPDIRRSESGRRELAEWIASTNNPLTARVLANRIWVHLFGRGLVPTPDNFGASGLPPSHPALLDYLADSFAENGWSVKKLIRTVVLSRAYRLSSQFDEKNFEVDPDNVLVWRMPKRRLEAEALRDTMLAVAGRLELTPPKGDSVQRGGEGSAAFRGRVGPGGGDPALTDTHRTAYLPIVRDGLPEMLTLFDFPDPSLIIGERATTTVPAQSLFLMNNPFVIRQAEAMADKLLAISGDELAKLAHAYQLCFSRNPSESELVDAQRFITEYGKQHSRRSTWAAFAQALFASAEFSQR
jgi:Protein of unknown function (DUF1553)/Protein of unknown function (DUF1549)/Planctomycete cytochrome C